MKHRYGDFPELFWDAQPDATLDADNPVVLARLLTRGPLDLLTRLVSPQALSRHFPTLPLNEHARAFWARVVYGFEHPSAESLTSPPLGP